MTPEAQTEANTLRQKLSESQEKLSEATEKIKALESQLVNAKLIIKHYNESSALAIDILSKTKTNAEFFAGFEYPKPDKAS